MEKHLVEHAIVFLKDRLSKYNLEVRRGDIDTLARQAVQYYHALTLPCVSAKKENIEQKMLYCLWGLVVDDCIDNGGDGTYLLGDTLKVLSFLPMGKKVNPQTPAGKVMNELVERILSTKTCNAEVGRTFFFLDVIEQIEGFIYDQIIHKRRDMATLFEYEEHSSLTKDHRVCLDIDVCTTETPLSPDTIKKIRKAFKFFGLALTYQGDIATFESEAFKEKSMNAVIILGIEEGVLPFTILDLEPAEKRAIIKKAVPPLFSEVRRRAMNYRELTIEKLREVEEIDTSLMEKMITYLIDKKFPGADLEREPTHPTEEPSQPGRVPLCHHIAAFWYLLTHDKITTSMNEFLLRTQNRTA
jgi:hypothetical protein